MRPGAYFDSDVSAVIRFHCTKNKIPIFDRNVNQSMLKYKLI